MYSNNFAGEIGLDEATAIRYQKNKALTDSRELRAMQSFQEGQGEFFDGGKVAQNRFLVGPIDDKDAYALVSYFAILVAREVPQNQRQPFIDLSDDYYFKALLTKEGNWFLDYRKEILLEGLEKIQSLLENTSWNGKSQGLVLLVESAKTSNLQFNDTEKFFLDRLIEAGEGMLETANEYIEAVQSIVIPGCKEGETKQECDRRLQREKYIKYGLLGLAGTSVVLFLGMPYLGAAKQFIGGLFGEDDE